MVHRKDAWEAYDPAWLVELALAQQPDEPWLASALRNCTSAMGVGGKVTYFIDPSRPNEPNSEWQFRENIILEHHEHGELVLDIRTGNRVGGVEFLARVLRG